MREIGLGFHFSFCFFSCRKKKAPRANTNLPGTPCIVQLPDWTTLHQGPSTLVHAHVAPVAYISTLPRTYCMYYVGCTTLFYN